MKNSTKILMGISGLLFVAAGIIAMVYPFDTILTISWLVGLFLLISGILEIIAFADIVHVFASTWFLFLGVTDVILGLFTLFNAAFVASILPAVFSLWLIFYGLDVVIHCADLAPLGFRGWWIQLVLGILMIALGIVSLLKVFDSSKVLAILIGIGLIVHGLSFFEGLYGSWKLEHHAKRLRTEFWDAIGSPRE